mgnify:FL=1
MLQLEMTARPHILFRILKKLFQDKRAFSGFILVLTISLVALLAPVIAPHDPITVNMSAKLQHPGPEYWLGTDNLGRCNLSRLIWGARASLFYAMVVLGIMLLISIPVGLIAGYAGGKVDAVIMRFIDLIMGFPSYILVLAIAGVLNPGMKNLILALSCVWWTGYARLIRGMVMQVKEKDFILAAQCGGCTRRRIIMRHIFSCILSPILVLSTLEVGSIILAIAGYSFIGLGAQPPMPEWGVMLSDSKGFMQTQPQLMLYPGLAIMLTVTSFNLLGEGLRNAMEHNI